MTTATPRRITVLSLGVMMLMGRGPLSAQDQPTGTVTINGETLSFTAEVCSWIDHTGILLLDLQSSAETGSLLFKFQEQAWEEGQRWSVAVQGGEVIEVAARQQIDIRASGHVFQARRRQAADGAWYVEPQGYPAPGPVYQRDSSTVTADVTFSRNTGETWVVELRVEGVSCLLKEPRSTTGR